MKIDHDRHKRSKDMTSGTGARTSFAQAVRQLRGRRLPAGGGAAPGLCGNEDCRVPVAPVPPHPSRKGKEGSGSPLSQKQHRTARKGGKWVG